MERTALLVIALFSLEFHAAVARVAAAINGWIMDSEKFEWTQTGEGKIISEMLNSDIGYLISIREAESALLEYSTQPVYHIQQELSILRGGGVIHPCRIASGTRQLGGKHRCLAKYRNAPLSEAYRSPLQHSGSRDARRQP
jgi:hypothetical protein